MACCDVIQNICYLCQGNHEYKYSTIAVTSTKAARKINTPIITASHKPNYISEFSRQDQTKIKAEANSSGIIPAKSEANSSGIIPAKSEANSSGIIPAKSEANSSGIIPAKSEANSGGIIPAKSEANSGGIIPAKSEANSSGIIPAKSMAVLQENP